MGMRPSLADPTKPIAIGERALLLTSSAREGATTLNVLPCRVFFLNAQKVSPARAPSSSTIVGRRCEDRLLHAPRRAILRGTRLVLQCSRSQPTVTSGNTIPRTKGSKSRAMRNACASGLNEQRGSWRNLNLRRGLDRVTTFSAPSHGTRAFTLPGPTPAHVRRKF